MKKIITVLLALAIIFSFAACESSLIGSKNVASMLPSDEMNTLNKILGSGYEESGCMISGNVFAQQVTNSKGEEFMLIVKVPAELMDALEAIDFIADDATQQYLDLIGDIELADTLVLANYMPDQKSLNSMYKGMTIAEFESGGAEITGYSGIDGTYSFFFSDGTCYFTVELEKGTKLEDYDDTAMFDAAIQDLKIGSIQCNGLDNIFVQSLVEIYIDPPEKAVPKEMGDPKSSIDEINAAIGSNLKAVDGATEEKFSVIDGKIAQYIYFKDDYYYCIRSSADTNIDLGSDDFDEYALVDEDGYVTTVSGQNDETHYLRFIFNGYQYAFIAYDNSEMDYMAFNAVSGEYQDMICVSKDGALINQLIGEFSSEDGYAMSGKIISEDVVQVSAYTFDDTQTKLWTMLVKEKSGKLTYDKSRLEIYLRSGEGNPAPTDAGKGTFTVKDGTVVWEKHVFKKN